MTFDLGITGTIVVWHTTTQQSGQVYLLLLQEGFFQEKKERGNYKFAPAIVWKSAKVPHVIKPFALFFKTEHECIHEKLAFLNNYFPLSKYILCAYIYVHKVPISCCLYSYSPPLSPGLCGFSDFSQQAKKYLLLLLLTSDDALALHTGGVFIYPMLGFRFLLPLLPDSP